MKGTPPLFLRSTWTATYKFDNSDDLIDVVQNPQRCISTPGGDNPSVVEVGKGPGQPLERL